VGVKFNDERCSEFDARARDLLPSRLASKRNALLDSPTSPFLGEVKKHRRRARLLYFSSVITALAEPRTTSSV
jgi:hypothetical protein